MGFLRRQILKWAYISTLDVGVYFKKTISILTNISRLIAVTNIISNTAAITTSKTLTVA